MQTVRITRAASAHPEHEVSQAEAAAYLMSLGGDYRRVSAVARGTRVAQRRTIRPAPALASLGTIEARNRIYCDEAPRLACAAASGIVDPSISQRVGILATSSCTGYDLPGLSARVVADLGLPIDVARVPLTEAGCAGGVVGLTVAIDHLRTRPGKAGLALAAELCSLAFHSGGDDSTLTSNMIFGDGAGAAILESGPGQGIEVVDTASVLVPETGEALGFRLTNQGFVPLLDRRLPRLVSQAFERAASAFLNRHCLQTGDVGAWLIHPGGAAILEGIEACLGVHRTQTAWSWESLHDYGNASSAAIFDVLARYLERPAQPGTWVVIAAFGPGISVDLVLGRQGC